MADAGRGVFAWHGGGDLRRRCGDQSSGALGGVFMNGQLDTSALADGLARYDQQVRERDAKLLTFLTLAEVYLKIGAVADVRQTHEDMRALLKGGQG